MSRTYRNKPTSGCYLRHLKYVTNLKIALHSVQDLKEYKYPIRNRVKASFHKTTNAWDDIVISNYRGQKWHRELKQYYKDFFSNV